MATQSHRKFMTYEEFEALPRYGRITMLLDGEYIVSPSCGLVPRSALARQGRRRETG